MHHDIRVHHHPAQLKLEPSLDHPDQPRPLEAHIGQLAACLQPRGDLFQFFPRYPPDGEGVGDAALLQVGVVADAERDQIGVGDDPLFAGGGAEAGCLEADADDPAGDIADSDAVALDEGLIEGDGEGADEVAEDALDGEGEGEAADAEPGEQGADADVEVVEGGDEDEQPEGDADDGADDGEVIGVEVAGDDAFEAEDDELGEDA